MASTGTVRYLLPCASFKPTRDAMDRLGLPPGDVVAIQSAFTAAREDAWAQVRPLCAAAAGSEATADSVEGRLAELRDGGILSFGAFRQKQALVTCIVPDPMHNDHMHFVDGAEGGYALAARMLKEQAVAAK